MGSSGGPLQGGEWRRRSHPWVQMGEGIPSGRYSRCKGPEVGIKLVLLNNSEIEAGVATGANREILGGGLQGGVLVYSEIHREPGQEKCDGV